MDEIDAELARPKFVMVNGPNCAGKTSWIEDFLKKEPAKKWVSLSIDDLIREFAEQHEVAKDIVAEDEGLSREFTRHVNGLLERALNNGENIIFDCTDTMPGSRNLMVRKVRSSEHHYRTISVNMMVSPEEQQERLAKRNDSQPNRYLDPDIAESTHQGFSERGFPIIKDETNKDGFDMVLNIPSPGLRATQWTKTVAGNYTGENRYK